ncbi:MAG: haloacid dehalogenase-like hydrolase, partial [Synergistaceae bacterium]|nr:haloacid dehalogenase-like hydrolase [Synergistaceae bacterium]
HLILDGRVNFVCQADYRKGKDIFFVVATVLEKMKSDFDFAELLKKHKTTAEISAQKG